MYLKFLLLLNKESTDLVEFNPDGVAEVPTRRICTVRVD